ncbi:MAG: helix-turn-helix domain-containing protein [Treponema sp.]
MQELGVLLKNTREEKQISLEQAARATNITKRHLEALETGEYHLFPGEPYIVGFLRNYAEYLSLDPNHCVQLYKQEKIKDVSVAPEQLIPKKQFHIPRSILLMLGGLVCVGFIVFFGNLLFAGLQNRTPDQEAEKNTEIIEQTAHTSYAITDQFFEKRIFAGDTLIVTLGDKQYELTVEKTAPALYLATHIGTQVIELGQSLQLDLNGDVSNDIKISVTDLDKIDETKGAVIEITTGAASGTAAAPQEDIKHAAEQNTASTGKYKVLFDAGSAYPVTLNATFRSYCLFRYEQDHTAREERYYQKSEQLTVQANNGIRIWASNGNAVKMQIIAGGKTIDIEVSRPGEVIVKDLKWVKDDESGRYKFVVINVD